MEPKKYSITEMIIGTIFLIAVIWVGLFLFKGVFKILSWAAPIMFIGALVINHKVVLSYGKMFNVLLQNNIVLGILALVLTFMFSPIVAALLLGLAVMNKKADSFMEQERQKRDGVPTDFKELSSTPKSGYDEILKSK